MENGKKTNLAPEQIRRLEKVGFRWSTNRKGRHVELDESSPLRDAATSAATVQLQQHEMNHLVEQHDNESVREAQKLLVEFSQSESIGSATNISGLGNITADDFV